MVAWLCVFRDGKNQVGWRVHFTANSVTPAVLVRDLSIGDGHTKLLTENSS